MIARGNGEPASLSRQGRGIISEGVIDKTWFLIASEGIASSLGLCYLTQ
jgi:hypothetical protein